MTDDAVPFAHTAVQLARRGQMSGKEMLGHLVAGKLVVPLSELPRIEEGRITGWQPATVSKSDGTQWLVAYTTSALAAAFCNQEPDHPLYTNVDTTWVLQTLPADYGIMVNFRTAEVFAWNAQGVAKYKREVLGW